MRWVLLGRFGDTTQQCAVFILGRHDTVAAILEPRARLRPSWDEDAFRAALRQWAGHHFPEVRPVLGLQYPLGPGLYETEWLLYCPLCGAGPFCLPAVAGAAGLAPRTWDDRRLAQELAKRFQHIHRDPEPPGYDPGAGNVEGEAAMRSTVLQGEPAASPPGQAPLSPPQRAGPGPARPRPEDEPCLAPAGRPLQLRLLPATPPRSGARPA